MPGLRAKLADGVPRGLDGPRKKRLVYLKTLLRGQTSCGKTLRKGHEVSGHDFSRAATCPKMNVGFTGCGKTRLNGDSQGPCKRARLQSCRKGRNRNVGFTGCGKTLRKGQEVSGHDFSRAAKVAIGTWALAPAGRLHTRFARCSPFFRSLSRPSGAPRRRTASPPGFPGRVVS